MTPCMWNSRKFNLIYSDKTDQWQPGVGGGDRL